MYRCPIKTFHLSKKEPFIWIYTQRDKQLLKYVFFMPGEDITWWIGAKREESTRSDGGILRWITEPDKTMEEVSNFR